MLFRTHHTDSSYCKARELRQWASAVGLEAQSSLYDRRVPFAFVYLRCLMFVGGRRAGSGCRCDGTGERGEERESRTFA